jgi:hypothetical protein
VQGEGVGVSVTIGTRIESASGPPWGAISWFVAAGATAAAAIFHPAWLLAAALPAGIGGALLLARRAPFSAALTAEGLMVDEPARLVVAYDAIQGLVGENRPRLPGLPGPRRFRIHVAHPGGVLEIPRRLNVSSDDLFRALAERVPEWGVRATNPALQDYRDRMERAYGAGRVWAFGAATHLAARTTYRALRFVCGALMLVGLVWAAGGGAMRFADPRGPAPVIIVLGGTLAGFGLIFLLASFASGSDRTVSYVKKWREASLVISPAGLALAQGDIVGELTWDQLRDLRLIVPPTLFSRRRGLVLTQSGLVPGIALKVPGTTIIVADVYERPLFVLYDHIHTYWRESGKRTAAEPDIPVL